MSTFSIADHQFMALAIRLAAKGRFTTTPNPNVGCVIVDNHKQILGQGWHQKAGEGHAEVNALADSNGSVEGGTAYVTLEPCSHTGRTPPCAKALIGAGIRRVVIANRDPNPQVAGKGIQMLQSAGVEVQTGLMAVQAAKLNRGFFKRMQHNMPWVTVKLAASLDGKVALQNGQSKWITSAEARRDVQVHRAQSCAILTGSNTVIADNPSMNVRSDELPESLRHHDRQPLKVIIDGDNRVTPSAKMLQSGHSIIFGRTAVFDNSEHISTLSMQINHNTNKLDLHACLQVLAERQINHVWVEAGANLSGALIEQNLVDEFILYQAPKIMGPDGRDLLSLSPFTSMNDVIEFSWADMRQIGNDIKYTAELTQHAVP